MPYSFQFDAANGLLQGRLYGRVNSDELREYYLFGTRCAAQMRPLAGITIRELAALRPAMPDAALLRVIVASSPDVFGMARIFESHGETTRPNLHVVRTCKEALAIVGVPAPQFQPIDLASLDEATEKK